MSTKKSGFKGRIIFLHGYTQSSSLFYAKTSALRKKLAKIGYKSVYLNGPLTLTPADLPSSDGLSKFDSVDPSSSDSDSFRAWWVKKSQVNNDVDISQTLDAIKSYVQNGEIVPDPDLKQIFSDEERELPIKGLVCFSQGSAIGGLICNQFDKLFNTSPLEFAVFYSGFKVDTSKKSGNEQLDKYYPRDGSCSNGLQLLHVFGELDTVVSEERSLSLYSVYKNDSTILKHPGGHFVPNSKVLVESVTNWILSTEIKDKKEPEEEDDLDSLLDMMDNLGKA